jgi:hypothetical protein
MTHLKLMKRKSVMERGKETFKFSPQLRNTNEINHPEAPNITNKIWNIIDKAVRVANRDNSEKKQVFMWLAKGKKRKAVPLQAWTAPEGSRSL